MKLYLHPKHDIADAAILAYHADNHLTGREGIVVVAPGRDQHQYDKALKVKALARLAREVRLAHNS